MHFQKTFLLICEEFKTQNKVNNLVQYFFGYLFLGTCALSLINNYSDINRFGTIFSIVSIPLGLLSFSGYIFKTEVQDGGLENLLSAFKSFEIVLSKYISLSCSAILGATLNLPFIYIIFGLNYSQIISLSLIIFLLIILASSLILITSAIQGYFRNNANFLSLIIIPLIVPSIILGGLALRVNNNLPYVLIMLGIDLIILPCSFYLSSLLVKNIYNI